jgi:hypothetical protein
MKQPTTGRRSLFRGKDKALPIRIIMTAIGHVAFRAARKELAKMTALPVKEVSLNDCAEWCIRGRPQLSQNEDGTYRVVEPQP